MLQSPESKDERKTLDATTHLGYITVAAFYLSEASRGQNRLCRLDHLEQGGTSSKCFYLSLRYNDITNQNYSSIVLSHHLLVCKLSVLGDLISIASDVGGLYSNRTFENGQI
jgi:hypothetical protein